MSKMGVPYKPGTKSFLIAQRLQKGEDYETIKRELRVERKTIYNVKSMLKKLGLLPRSSAAPAISPPSSSEPSAREPPYEPSLSVAPSREIERKPLGKSEGLGKEEEKLFAEGAERELMLQATPIVRKVVLNPRIYLLYDYARTRLNFDGDLGDFLADCVDDFFNSRGIKIKIVREEEVS